jgi:hypothetical protein
VIRKNSFVNNRLIKSPFGLFSHFKCSVLRRAEQRGFRVHDDLDGDILIRSADLHSLHR